ncbi:MAG: ribonuclease R [Enterococcus sp.]|nr:ribonuclease R [Enterococcus sp.]
MKETIKTKIVQYLEKSNKKSFSLEEIAEVLSLQKGKDFQILVQTIAKMEQEKSIVFTKKGKIKLPQKLILLEGVFRRNERGFGFVTVDPEEDDIYIPKEQTGFALDGDTVAIDITHPADPFNDRGAEGKVVEIRKRNLTQVVGEFTLFSDEEIRETDLYGVVKPKDKKLGDFKIFIAAEGIRPMEGSIVLVEITHYPEAAYATSLEGIVKQVIGYKNDPGMDILSIVISNGIPTQFQEATLKQADEVPDEIDPADFPTRRNLIGQSIVTIDGEDAKDLDDAITVRRLENGHYFLGVHIADVSYYVTKDSPLDQEAFERGTSVYLTDRVIPMLPQRLSNGICSLNPKVPRLAMSCEMEIDLTGKVVNYDIFESVIQSVERMTYADVNEILEQNNSEIRSRYAALVPMFEEMAALHHLLENMRTKRGAVTFEDREAKVLVDEEGHPLEIVFRKRGVGERLIESFMLAANETVAKHYHQKKFPFIYRIHEDPKEEKMRRFLDFASILGLVVKNTKGKVSPKDLQAIVQEVAEKPESMVINTMLLRSMQQAKYSENNEGHYGLAAEYYTHFTSPIRRYPDLIVHRLIRSYQLDKTPENKAYWEENLPDIAIHSSQMERRAVNAEREVDALKKAEYMLDHIDEEFDGVISSVAKFGFFVELPNTIEGLIHLTTLKQDYFHYFENHLALVGERTGQTFKIGQKVRIKVAKSDPETREIDFELVSAETIEPIVIKKQGNFRKNKNVTENKRTEKQEKDRKKYRNKKKTQKQGPFYAKALKKSKKKSDRKK